MFKLAILDTAVRGRGTQDGVNAGPVPALQVSPLELDALEVQRPHVGRGQLGRDAVRLHLGPPRLPGPFNLAPDGRAAVGHEHALQEGRALELVLGRPVHDLVAGGAELVRGRPQRPRHGRRRARHAVVPHDGDAQAGGQDGLAPRDRQTPGVREPGLGAHHGRAVKGQVGQGASQGTVDALHGLLARHARAAAQGWEAAEAGPQGKDAGAGGGDAQGAANIGADANGAAPEGDEGRLATRGAAAGEITVQGADGAAEDVVDRLGNHHGRGDIGLDVEHGARGLEERRQRRVVGSGVANVAHESHGGVQALEVEVVLEGDGQAVEGPDGLAGCREVLI